VISRRDRGARIILSGLFAHPKSSLGWPGAAFLQAIYGVTGMKIKARFDGVALHPYATDAAELRPEVEGRPLSHALAAPLRRRQYGGRRPGERA
jgi:hypothetical protein